MTIYFKMIVTSIGNGRDGSRYHYFKEDIAEDIDDRWWPEEVIMVSEDEYLLSKIG